MLMQQSQMHVQLHTYVAHRLLLLFLLLCCSAFVSLLLLSCLYAPFEFLQKPKTSKDAVVATSMSLINRFAVLIFPLPTILLLLQMVATLVILYPLLVSGVLNFPLFRWTRFCQLFGIAALYTVNTAFALFGLKTLNLPM